MRSRLLRLSCKGVTAALLVFSSAAIAQSNRPAITSSTNALGTVGEPFTYVITASGNPTGFGASSLPPGLLPPGSGLFPPDSNKIVGLPQVPGSFTSIISAANAFGSAVTNTNLFITVNPPPVPQLASPATVFGVAGQPLRYQLFSVPNHSNVPTRFSASNLPPGLSLSVTNTTNSPYTNVVVTNYSVGGIISSSAVGSFVVPVVMSNAGGSITSNVTFIINPTNAPVFTVSTNPVTGTVGVPFSYDVTAINGPLFFRAMSIAVGTYVTNPFTGNITNNFSPPVNLNGTSGLVNGTLTNGLSISNVTIGSSTVARISGTPGGAYPVRITLRADNNYGFAVTDFIVAVVNPTPTVVLSQPLGEGNYVSGSSFYLNAQVFDEPEDILVPSSYQFQENGNAVPGSVGILGDYFGLEYYPAINNPSITASGQNAFGQTTNSVAFPMGNTAPRNPLPSVEMLPLNFGQQLVAGGKVRVSARATIPSTTVSIDRVEFYVNKVYVGSSAAPVTTDGVYEFEWTTPTTPGSFQLTARAVSLNWVFSPPSGDTINYWASVIARKPTIVNTKQGTAPSVLITSPANNGNLSIGVANRIQATALLSGGAIQSVEFFANGQRISSLDATGGTSNPDTQVPFEVDFVPNSFGAYEIYAIATGSNGLQTVSPVIVANAPTGFVPSVAITSPTSGLTLPLGQAVVVEYTSNDTDGFVAKVELLANGAVVSTLPDPTAGTTATGLIGNGSFPYTPPSQGVYEFAVRVTDDRGNSGISAPVRITVQSGATSPLPTVTLDLRTISETEYVLGSSLQLNATATPKGANTISATDVKFFINGNQTPATNSGIAPRPGVFTALFTPTEVGTYEVRATARDSAGNTGLSGVARITVSAPDIPFPEVEMLPLNPGTAPVQGGLLNLQARAVFPASSGSASVARRVEFYVNGAFVGVGTNSQTALGDFSYIWRVPSGLNALTNSYTVQARAVNDTGNSLAAVAGAASVFSGNNVPFSPGPVGAAPVVDIKAPENREFTMPQAPLTLLWSARDPDGFVVFTQLFVNGEPYSGSDSGDTSGATTTPVLFPGGNGTAIYQFPSQGKFVFVVRATDNSGNTADSSPITVTVDNSFADPGPIVTLNNSTFADQGYVVGSQLYFNATATASGTNTIPTNGVSFALGSTISLPGSKSSLTLGNNPVFSSSIYTIGAGSPSTVAARATDSQGNIGFSPLNTFYFGNPFSPLPAVSMVTNTPVTPPVAGGILELRALANFPVTQFNRGSTNLARVEFYANGVLLGDGSPVTRTNTNSSVTLPYTHVFPWLIPTNASGDFRITARAVQLNYNTPSAANSNTVTPFYGSVISLNSAQVTISAVPSDLVPGSNGAFVVEMYRKLLYRDPDYNEWDGFVQALDALQIDRATVVMTIMGFDQTLKVFNRSVDYGRYPASAMLPFARLGLAPTQTQVQGFITAIQGDATPLPIPGIYSGIPDAPWGATYGFAQGMQEVFIRSSAFKQAYPAVTGLANTPFNEWMREKMFAGVSGGDESRILEMLNTIQPQSIRQGAAMAFRSELAWVSLESGYEINPEQNLQLRANTAMLNFQLKGTWNLTKTTPLYSKQVVEGILASAGYITAPSAPAAVAREQSIRFRPPTKVYAGRTYRLTARSTSTLPVTLLLQDLDAATSIVSSGPNTLTFKVNRAGSINVIAAQPGGTSKRGSVFRAAAPVQSSITAVQK